MLWIAARRDGCGTFSGFEFPAIPAALKVLAISRKHVKNENMARGCWPALPVHGAQVIPAASGQRVLESRVLGFKEKEREKRDTLLVLDFTQAGWM